MKPGRIFAAGGGAKSAFWRQIVSDILQEPISFYPESTGCFGGALIAAHAMGNSVIHNYFNENSKPQILFPNIENSTIYDDNFQRYLELSKLSL